MLVGQTFFSYLDMVNFLHASCYWIETVTPISYCIARNGFIILVLLITHSPSSADDIGQDSKPSNERAVHQVQTYTSLERRTDIAIDTIDTLE